MLMLQTCEAYKLTAKTHWAHMRPSGASQGHRRRGKRKTSARVHLSFSSLVSQLRPPTNTLHSCLDMLRGCRPCVRASDGTWETWR